MPFMVLFLAVFGTARLVHSAWTGVVRRRFGYSYTERDQPGWYFASMAVLAVAVGLSWMMTYEMLASSTISISISR